MSKEKGCWLCFWMSDPSAPGISRQNSESNPLRNQEQGRFREIRALEYRESDVAVRYYLTIPEDISYGEAIQVDLGGRIMSIIIPENVQIGEKVIIVAPADLKLRDILHATN